MLVVMILVRITPTYMGNTKILSTWTRAMEDHPHIHGEYVQFVFITVVRTGSPPHTWGIRHSLRLVGLTTRITPTYMGNTPIHQSIAADNQDHPHIHGEYQVMGSRGASAQGSPPHTWGIPDTWQSRQTPCWITPTYMGNTFTFGNIHDSEPDHPHIHGEYSKQIPI